MDAQTLAAAMDNRVPRERYEALTPAWNAALLQAGCTTVDRVAMWCSQIGHESGGLKWMQEIADGSAYEGRADLGNTQPGDGRRFKGHGPIQITGRYNHTKVSEWALARGYVPTPTFFVDDPNALAGEQYGFLGAVWYWTVARNMNGFADARDIEGASRAVNGTNRKTGRANGIDDRITFYNRALRFGDALLPTEDFPMSEATEIKHQLTGSPNPGEYPGWPQLGDQTVVDALADVRDVLTQPFESLIDENGKVSFDLPTFIKFIDAATYRTEKKVEALTEQVADLIKKLGGK
ncbi:hypothetical protein CH267_02175 [Rhodococcus sp. 06-621-2]|nr:hypothetical protein [Rhodococcus sp. 06-621-2]OZC62366.1 hypothetical protein CH267_02175 [Rhodococcus sp. 06-621-2]